MELEKQGSAVPILPLKSGQHQPVTYGQWSVDTRDLRNHILDGTETADLPDKDMVNFSKIDGRDVVFSFDGGVITTNTGALPCAELLGQNPYFLSMMTAFGDTRTPSMVAHPLKKLVLQGILKILAGYANQNHCDDLKSCGGLTAVLEEFNGVERKDVATVAGRMSMQRLENAVPAGQPLEGNQKITFDQDVFNQVQLDHATDAIIMEEGDSKEDLVVDPDGTFSLVHGEQEGRKFNGHKKGFGYMPELFFYGNHLLSSILRPGTAKADEDTLENMKRIYFHMSDKLPSRDVVFRGDADYSRPNIINWCHEDSVKFLFGLSGNKGLLKIVGPFSEQVKRRAKEIGETVTDYMEFTWKPAAGTWTSEHRIVVKVEYLITEYGETLNTRFLVTNLGPEYGDARHMYEKRYAPRGDSENRIKENQLFLFGKKMSNHNFFANQMRLNLVAMAYTSANLFRIIALSGTEHAEATWDTIRTKVIKVPAQVVKTAKQIRFKVSTQYQYKDLFTHVCQRIMAYRETQSFSSAETWRGDGRTVMDYGEIHT